MNKIMYQKLYTDLTISYRFMDRVLKDFITFLFFDIKKDKYLLKFNPSLWAGLKAIELKVKIKSGDIRTVYLVIQRDKTFINIDPSSIKDCLFEMDTEDIFESKESYRGFIKQIKKEIKVYIDYWR